MNDLHPPENVTGPLGPVEVAAPEGGQEQTPFDKSSLEASCWF